MSHLHRGRFIRLRHAKNEEGRALVIERTAPPALRAKAKAKRKTRRK